jgi:hypothetical protein
VHGSWTTAFVSGRHEYLLPTTPDRGTDGAGLATTWDWSATTRDVPFDLLRDEDVDVVVLQRMRDLELVRKWMGREPGRDLPAVFLRHNTPGLEPEAGPSRTPGIPSPTATTSPSRTSPTSTGCSTTTAGHPPASSARHARSRGALDR